MKQAIVFFLCLHALPGILLSQGVYEMSNDSISICEGQLVDSNDGVIFGDYDHNENYVFTICIPEADANITMNFLSFCTEEDFDSLRIFDGPDTLSTQIGPAYHGVNSPGTIITTGNCITLHFVSDANITCSGWVAEWSTEVTVPTIPPIGLANTSPPCSTQSLLVNFAHPISCTDLLSGVFSIDGPVQQTITALSPINCADDSTMAVLVDFSPGLEKSGYYTVSFVNSFLDACETPWLLSSKDSLFVDDCPIEVEIQADPTNILCPDDCANLSVLATGGDLQTYHYYWTQGLPDSTGPFQICPDSSLVYIVQVTDDNNSPPGSDTIYVTIRTNPKIFTDSVFCQSDTGLFLQAAPSGGTWVGSGVSNSTGWFDPGIADIGPNTLIYTDPFGCVDSTEVEIRAIDAGEDEASCPGGGAFELSGFSPIGGVWSGSFVSDSGLFSPPALADTLTLTYAINGCTDEKDIFVANIVLADTVDTLCQSTAPFQLSFSPSGGSWSGQGITNSSLGIFSPAVSGPGLHTLFYELNGCKDSIELEVIALSIGGNLSMCPENEPIWLGVVNPPGGIWSGGGIIDPDSGIYDPSFVTVNAYIDTITYTYGGCSDSRFVFVRKTVVGADTLSFCKDHAIVELGASTTQNLPFDGLWSGPGVISASLPGLFDPAVAGIGVHRLTYSANGCSDTLIMVIQEGAGLGDTAVCEFSDPIPLFAETAGGFWSGVGIVDTTGIFDPEVVGVGDHTVYYQTPEGCTDSTVINVFTPPTPQILDLSGVFCYQDTVVALRGYPEGGYFYGPGIISDSLHVLLADSGSHPITYFLGEGACMTFMTNYIQITPPLQVHIETSDDTICQNSFATLVGVAEDGLGSNYSYFWPHSQSVEDTVGVTPGTTQTYTVYASDGCSIGDTAHISVAVKDDFQVTFETSDPVCIGEEGYLIPHIEPEGLYAVQWQNSSNVSGDTLFGEAFFRYRARIIDVLQGCEKEVESEIPSHDFVHAAFSPNPNRECVTTRDPTYVFLNKSEGATEGLWDFGDGTTEAFIPNYNPSHTYPEEIQSYSVILYLDNGFGCTDTATAEVCIEPEEWAVYVPNVFSPNQDQINDHLVVSVKGIQEYQLKIVSRMGHVVFESNNPEESWDGRFKGKLAPEGVYVYHLSGIIESDDPAEHLSPLQKVGTITLIR